MTMTREAVIAIIAEEAGIDPARLSPEATLIELDISSIDLASAVFAIEEQFGVEIDPDAIDRDGTLDDLVDQVMALPRR